MIERLFNIIVNLDINAFGKVFGISDQVRQFLLCQPIPKVLKANEQT